ncbi:hypothetical protein [Cyclobacterium marinum]|uniref:hypothetical protein n=1 Tax=Cyclobacterium marinum TaxID=104 RepID=UPI0011ED632C|nr:hypothetical protein [Cyclobacterium marinum]MBI0398043.1 hypothetical protein [Cyclobacterium marinum]
MNIQIISATILLFAAFGYSCKQENKVEKMKAEVMAVHDEVMPEMGNLMNLKSQLKEKSSNLDSLDDSGNLEELNLLIQNLEEADEAMMDWMRNYKDPSGEMNEEQAMEYLKEKMKSIKEVKQKINTSKAKARKALK